MLEIFLRDRDIDYDMFVYHNEKFHYITKEKNKKNNALYCGLSTGTIILDGVVLNNTLTNLEQINYIKEILNSFADIVDAYRKKYEPAYVKYTFDESIGDIIINGRIIEVPNRYQFHEYNRRTRRIYGNRQRRSGTEYDGHRKCGTSGGG